MRKAIRTGGPVLEPGRAVARWEQLLGLLLVKPEFLIRKEKARDAQMSPPPSLIPEIRNTEPETRDPSPETRNPKPEFRTRDPRPEIRDLAKPGTRNPEPETRYPKPGTRKSTLQT